MSVLQPASLLGLWQLANSNWPNQPKTLGAYSRHSYFGVCVPESISFSFSSNICQRHFYVVAPIPKPWQITWRGSSVSNSESGLIDKTRVLAADELRNF